jgi:hypothetical protein
MSKNGVIQKKRGCDKLIKELTTCLTGFLMMAGTTGFAAIPSTDIAIGGIKPGMNIDEAIAAFGQPTYHDQGEEALFQNGIKIDLDDYTRRTIEEIKLSGSSDIATPAGITIGSSESAVTEAYGHPDKLKNEDGVQEYTYYAADSGMKIEFKVIHGTVAKIKCELNN